MNKFWFFFLRLSGMALVMVLVAAVNFGIIQRSWTAAYSFMQKILAVSAGIAAVTGLVALSVEMILKRRAKNGGKKECY